MSLDVYRRSRGKGLTDLQASPTYPARSKAWWTWLCAGSLFWASCATIPVTEVYHVQPAVLVVTTDLDLIARACWNAKVYAEGQIVGCYVPTSQPPAIYCPSDNAEVCWYEIFDHHILGLRH